MKTKSKSHGERTWQKMTLVVFCIYIKKDINIHSTRQMKKLLIISKKEAKRKCGDNIVTYVKRFHEIFNKESVLINGRTTYM